MSDRWTLLMAGLIAAAVTCLAVPIARTRQKWRRAIEAENAHLDEMRIP